MKTQLNQQQPLCENGSKQSYSLLLLLSVFLRPLHLEKLIHALRDILDSLVASLNEVILSKRYTAGIIFLAIVAPLSSIFYLVFDPSVITNGWYFANYFYYFYSLSPYLMLLFGSVGTFLLFPVKCKTSYLATVWPSGYAIAKLFYLGLFVQNDTQFHSAAPWFILIAGFLLAISLLLSVDYLLYRKYHLHNGTLARIVGLIKTPGLDDHTRVHLLQDQANELENFNQRY